MSSLKISSTQTACRFIVFLIPSFSVLIIVLGEGTATSKTNSVDIDPCDKQPCVLKKGTEEVI